MWNFRKYALSLSIHLWATNWWIFFFNAIIKKKKKNEKKGKKEKKKKTSVSSYIRRRNYVPLERLTDRGGHPRQMNRRHPAGCRKFNWSGNLITTDTNITFTVPIAFICSAPTTSSPFIPLNHWYHLVPDIPKASHTAID